VNISNYLYEFMQIYFVILDHKENYGRSNKKSKKKVKAYAYTECKL
jgi:hypothetical protein